MRELVNVVGSAVGVLAGGILLALVLYFAVVIGAVLRVAAEQISGKCAHWSFVAGSSNYGRPRPVARPVFGGDFLIRSRTGETSWLLEPGASGARRGMLL